MIKMIHGDCMTVMADMKDKQFQLALVDPPYGIKRFKNGIGKGDRHTVKASGGFNNLVPDKKYFEELFRISKNQIIWGANNFTLPPTEYFCIWDKMQTVDNFASAEYAWVSMGCNQPAMLFRYSIHQHNADKGKIHPTQKPVRLYEWLLNNYAKSGDKILDTHGGSGSICIACDALGFDLDWYEIDKDYYDAAVDRFNRHKQQQVFDFNG